MNRPFGKNEIAANRRIHYGIWVEPIRRAYEGSILVDSSSKHRDICASSVLCLTLV
jgi:hypothetical protein